LSQHSVLEGLGALTYKSITELIKDRIVELHGKELHYLPQRFGGLSGRDLFVSSEVLSDVCEPFPETREGIWLEAFRATLDHYSSGRRMTVSERPPRDRPPRTLLAKPQHATIKDVWDFRSLDADDGIRCFGAFGGRNLFIALTWNFRKDMNFAKETETCMAEWNRLFPGIPPFRGKTLDEYGSNFKDY
jgi:hypothetical protein